MPTAAMDGNRGDSAAGHAAPQHSDCHSHTVTAGSPPPTSGPAKHAAPPQQHAAQALTERSGTSNSQARPEIAPKTSADPFIDPEAFASWIDISSTNGDYEYSDTLNSSPQLSDFRLVTLPATQAQIQDPVVALNANVIPFPNILDSALASVPTTVRMQTWFSGREDDLQHFMSHSGAQRCWKRSA